MKKMILIAIVSTLFSSANAMAWWINGASVDKVKVTASGQVVLTLTNTANGTSKRLVNVNNADANKMVLAAAMTAYSTGKPVNAWIASSQITELVLVQ